MDCVWNNHLGKEQRSQIVSNISMEELPVTEAETGQDPADIQLTTWAVVTIPVDSFSSF